MKTLIALLLFIVFLFLSAIHIYWGLGGKWASDVTIPTKMSNEKVMNPGRAECFAVAIWLFCFGAFILIKAGIILVTLPHWLLNYGLWIISAIFILRAIGEFKYVGFFKKIRATKFGLMDTMYYSPLCLLIGLLGIIIEFIS